jgi:hypothetical protein
MEEVHKILAILIGKKRIVEVDLRNSRDPPITMFSMLGWVAAVIAIVSPSQPRPAVIQSTSISLIGSGLVGLMGSIMVYECRWKTSLDRIDHNLRLIAG